MSRNEIFLDGKAIPNPLSSQNYFDNAAITIHRKIWNIGLSTFVQWCICSGYIKIVGHIKLLIHVDHRYFNSNCQF